MLLSHLNDVHSLPRNHPTHFTSSYRSVTTYETDESKLICEILKGLYLVPSKRAGKLHRCTKIHLLDHHASALSELSRPFCEELLTLICFGRNLVLQSGLLGHRCNCASSWGPRIQPISRPLWFAVLTTYSETDIS